MNTSWLGVGSSVIDEDGLKPVGWKEKLKENGSLAKLVALEAVALAGALSSVHLFWQLKMRLLRRFEERVLRNVRVRVFAIRVMFV